MKHDFKKVLINEEASLKEALQIIEKSSLKIAILVDKKEKLIGIITDGDIRRSLLAGNSLSSQALLAANLDPIVISKSTTKSETRSLMKKYQILSIPVVENKRLVGLKSFHDHDNIQKKENPVFIMAGGFGSRLSPLTDNCPKPMLKIGGIPILERSISLLKKHGFYKFFISLHYLSEQVIEYFGDGSDRGIEINYIFEEKPLGTGGALGLLPELNHDYPLLMINGDILTKLDFSKFLKFHNKNDADCSVCVREYDFQIPFGVIEGDGDLISSIIEKPTKKFFVNAGVYILNRSIIESVHKNQYSDMPTLLHKNALEGRRLMKFLIHEYWIDIGQIHDFNRAQEDIKRKDFE